MSLYAYDDSPYELEPGEHVCAECGGVAEEVLDGLCERCRCVDCGAPDAPVELEDARWCRSCASDRGYVRPVALELEGAA